MAFTSKTTFATNIATGQNVAATEKQGARGHATIHNNIGTVLNSLQDKVGIDNSTDATSIDYKLTNTASVNPGHNHTLEDGATDVTASAAELNILDGVTASTAELNVLDGIPGTLTATELGYVDGVTSAIQTQLDAKAPKANPEFTGSGTIAVNFTSTTGYLQGGYALRVYDATNNGTGLQLGDAAGNFDVNLYRSAANTAKTDDNLIVAGTVTSNAGNVVTVDGTQTLTNKTLTSPALSGGSNAVILDDAGNEFFSFTKTASAVNQIDIANAGTGNGPTISATGGDTNIDLKLDAKGSGTIKPLDKVVFADSATIPPMNITERSSAPSGPASNDLYLDDGTNTGGTPAFRRYTGSGWETVGGTGTGTTGADFTFDWSNAVLPDTNFPSIGKTVGTNWVYKTLDFDQTTSESCYWYFVVPSDLSSITSATMKIQWTASSGSGTFISSVVTRSPSDDEVIDATTTPSSAAAVTVTDTLLATGDLHQASLALTTTGWAAGDLIQVKFSRDISDTLSGDAKVIQVLLELR